MAQAHASQYPPELPHDVKEKVQLVSELEQLLSDLDLRKQRAQALLGNLKDELAPYLVPQATLESSQISLRTLDVLANSKASIHRFPTEILSMIFALALIPNHHRIRTLVLVCRHWNEMVMQNPSLWSRLQIIAPRDPQKHPWRTWMDDMKRYLSACLHCSRTLGLWVEMDLLDLPSPSDYIADQLLSYAKSIIPSEHARLTDEMFSNTWEYESRAWEELIEDICKVLFTGPCYKIERWAALSLRLPHSDSMIAEHIWNSITGVASNLKELSIENLLKAPATDGELHKGPEGLPALESLTIIGNNGAHLHSFPFTSNNLKHLKLSIRVGTHDLRDLLLSPYLLTLELMLDYDGTLEIPSFKLRLPILQSLVISGRYSILRNIDFDLPSLKVLGVHTRGQLGLLPNVAPLRINWMVDPLYHRLWKPRPTLNTIVTLMKFSKSTEVIKLPKFARPYAANAAIHLMVTGELSMFPCLKHLVVEQENGKLGLFDLRDKALLETMAARMNEAKIKATSQGDHNLG